MRLDHTRLHALRIRNIAGRAQGTVYVSLGDFQRRTIFLIELMRTAAEFFRQKLHGGKSCAQRDFNLHRQLRQRALRIRAVELFELLFQIAGQRLADLLQLFRTLLRGIRRNIDAEHRRHPVLVFDRKCPFFPVQICRHAPVYRTSALKRLCFRRSHVSLRKQIILREKAGGSPVPQRTHTPVNRF